MTKLAAVVIALLLAGCASRPLGGTDIVPPEYRSRKLNACLPEAVEMMQRLRVAGLEANVLIFRARHYSGSEEISHAICVYFAPPGYNQLWGWDADHGSSRLVAYRDDALQMARAWLKSVKINTDYVIISARFLESSWK